MEREEEKDKIVKGRKSRSGKKVMFGWRVFPFLPLVMMNGIWKKKNKKRMLTAREWRRVSEGMYI